MDETRRREVALAAAEAGAALASDRFRTDLSVERKGGKTDVVTAADRDAQAAVREHIAEAFPGEPLVGEENDARQTVPEEGHAWIVDPIDGTNNYVREVPVWTTAVAAVHDGEPVASAVVAPELGERYVAGGNRPPTRNGDPISVADRSDPELCTVAPTVWWPQNRREEYAAAVSESVRTFADARRYGSAQYDLALVASGSLDGAFTNVVTNPWDTVAGTHLVREAGGTVTDVHGDRWTHDSRGIVATSGPIHREVSAVVETVEAQRAGRSSNQSERG